LGFVAYHYLLSHRVKRVAGKLGSQNLLGSQQTKGNYDVDWIPKHHLVQSKENICSNKKNKFFLSFIKIVHRKKAHVNENLDREMKSMEPMGQEQHQVKMTNKYMRKKNEHYFYL
jgi:hypothetical protein